MVSQILDQLQYPKLDHLGTIQCKNFREKIFDRHRPFACALRAEYSLISEQHSYVDANLRLLGIDELLRRNELNLSADDDVIQDFCLAQAKRCSSIKSALKNKAQIYQLCARIVSRYGLELPIPDEPNDGSEPNVSPCINRMGCERWWRRQVRRLQAIALENVARDLRLVHNHQKPYCSTVSLQRHRYRKKSNRDFLEARVAVNEQDKEYTLAELSDKSVSNPSIRRMELITRINGLETVAKGLDHDGIFITLTAPSRFHRMTQIFSGGKLVKVISNKNYEGSTPRDAQDHLNNVWGRIQAKLGREKIKSYGFRIAEPHHDGTPHFHFLLFVDKKHTDQLISIFQLWALKDSPEEKGALKHRLKVERIKTGINPSTGREYSATGYLIKYICKNVDGYGIDNTEKSASGRDWSGKNPNEVAERIEAWARTHRIRQFQPIGGPSVTAWRQLRRMPEQEGKLEEIRSAAHNGDWAGFVNALGGPTISRKEQLVRPAYAKPEKLDRQTGEVSTVVHTVYGDEASDRVVGVLIAGMTVLSRSHFWEIKDNENVQSAQQKIMDGIVDMMTEIRDQNLDRLIPPHTLKLLKDLGPAPAGPLEFCQ